MLTSNDSCALLYGNARELILAIMRCKLLCSALLSFFIFSNSFCQVANKPADVIIIGLNHHGNKVYNADTLTKALLLLQPEVILDESDSVRGYFSRQGEFKRKLPWLYRLSRKLRIADAPAVEYTATCSYLKAQPTTMVHPFDKTIRKSRKYLQQMIKLDMGFWKALYYAHINNEMSDRQNELYHQWTFYERFLDRSINFPLWRMNNDTTTQLLRKKDAFEYTYFKQFVDSVPSLRRFAAAITADQNEWTERNNIMTKNILKFIAQYPGKRIVVLTGNKHRYLLLDLLSPHSAAYHFRLLDLYGNEITIPEGHRAISSR